MDTEFETAVETVKAKANGMLLDGLEYIRDCMDNDDYHLVTLKEIQAYHLVCYKMRPLFFGPNE